MGGCEYLLWLESICSLCVSIDSVFKSIYSLCVSIDSVFKSIYSLCVSIHSVFKSIYSLCVGTVPIVATVQHVSSPLKGPSKTIHPRVRPETVLSALESSLSFEDTSHTAMAANTVDLLCVYTITTSCSLCLVVVVVLIRGSSSTSHHLCCASRNILAFPVP